MVTSRGRDRILAALLRRRSQFRTLQAVAVNQ
jgi:hypothetical protein